MSEAPLAVAGAMTVEPPDDSHALEATRRRLSPRQAEAVMHLVRATGEEVEEVGYSGLTVRNVARRAGVAPATAYNYFSSKDHLLAEVLWRRIQALPPIKAPVTTSESGSVSRRLTDAVSAMVLFTTESPALVDACTVALLSSNPDVKHLRDRIGAQIHHRLVAAVGPDVDPLVVRVLETCFSGSLLAAGMGHMPYGDIPGLVTAAAELLVERATRSPRPSHTGAV
jgi:AcrR family transcriptional regulator